MKLNILKTTSLLELKYNIQANLDNYISGDFKTFFADPAKVIELDIDIEPSKFDKFLPGKSPKEEVHNCLLMFEMLGSKVTPYLARDERLWTYLTHTYLLEYSRERWEINKNNEIVEHIKTHFFASDKRGIERGNAASRLWWIATLCGRVEGLPLREVLDCLLFHSDVRASIIERPTTAQCLNVFSAIIKKFHFEYGKGNEKIFERKTYRELMKKINLLGGIKLLNTMQEARIIAFIDESLASM